MKIEWAKRKDGDWYNLLAVNLDNQCFNDLRGVYIIWSGDQVVRLGSGVIRDKLTEHIKTPEITRFRNLKVTWACVNGNHMEGIETYLFKSLNPLLGEYFSNRKSIPVNFPW